MNMLTTSRATYATYADLIRHRGDVSSGKIAVHHAAGKLTYGELLENARRTANALIDEGFGPGTRIGYIGKNDSRYYELVFGCALSRTVLAPVSWRLNVREVIWLLNDFDVEMLVISKDFIDLLPALLEACKGLKLVLALEGATDNLRGFDDWKNAHSGNDPRLDISPNDDLLQLHTSGTTGSPKGAVLTHANQLGSDRSVDSGALGPWKEDDIMLICLPLFHSGGTCFSLHSFYAGGSIYLCKEAHPDLILEGFERLPITKMCAVPAVYQFLLEHPAFSPEKVASLEHTFYGGAPITVPLLKRCMKELGSQFVQVFGMTESSTQATALAPEDHDPQRAHLLESCGRILPGMEIRIVNPETGEDCGARAIGEIWLKGASIMRCYYKRPEQTSEVLIEGWYRTGDAGYLDEEGFLFIKDRLKDMIISGGENIYPAEVETVIAGHPAVLEVAVIGVPSEKWGEEVKAFVALRKGADAPAAEIIAFTRDRIAHYKCPKSVEFIDALPRSGTGKVLKRVLRHP